MPGEEAVAPDLGAAVDIEGLLGEEARRFSKEERNWIAKAYAVANDAHLGVMRASGDPYIDHPVAVARTLLCLNLGWHSVCAALLHDTVEDTTLTYGDLKDAFPDPIADLVMGVTKISSLNFRTSHEEQVENLRKMILAMARDIRVILIKLADRRHNIETLGFLSQAKQKRIARSTIEIYAPLAGRLGIYRIKSDLEDGAMRYLYPDAYRKLSEAIAQKRRDRERHIDNSIRYLEGALAEHGIQAQISGRSKHFWSIYNKMRTQNLSFEEIYDLNAMRVICRTHKECYEILGIIHSAWKPVPEHFSDYIALPKANMYQSIHTKVIGLEGQLTEIQIRTEEMHRVAEQGIAAHLSYKEGKKFSSIAQDRLAWLRQMVGWIQDANDPGELLNDLKREAFEAKVFCFTPRGDVIEMGRGATILDFAYRIHTDLGHRCTGGKINSRFVPLRTQLKMGDIVEIATSKTPHPSADWLKIVTTARARAKIRHALKQRDYDKNVLLGHDLVAKALSKAGIHVTQQELRDVLELHLKRLHARTVEDIYAEVGFGAIPTTIVVARFLPTPAEQPSRRRVAPKKKSDSVVLVDGMPGSLTRFAQCCRPHPSDPISGFVTRGRGVSVHHRDCPHLSSLMARAPDHMSRFVPVSWSVSAETQFRKAAVRITAEDRTGILAELTKTISSMGIVIVASSSRSNPRNHRMSVRFSFMIRTRLEFDSMVEKLREIPDVISVTRDTRIN